MFFLPTKVHIFRFNFFVFNFIGEGFSIMRFLRLVSATLAADISKSFLSRRYFAFLLSMNDLETHLVDVEFNC